MELQVTPLSAEERKRLSFRIIGKTKCPICGQDDISVANDNGKEGNPHFNYIEDHFFKDEPNLCGGSDYMLHSF